MEERILGPAILHDGVSYKLPAPKRHHHVIHDMAKQGHRPAKGQQGFYTNLRAFIDRQEGKLVARQSGQNIRNTGAPDTLFTEDMW